MTKTEIKGNGPPETVELIEQPQVAGIFSRMARLAIGHEHQGRAVPALDKVVVLPHISTSTRMLCYIMESSVKLKDDVIEQFISEVYIDDEESLIINAGDYIDVGQLDQRQKNLLDIIDMKYRQEIGTYSWTAWQKDDAPRT
jgi:hypothetical protein